ncbi:hypothetical protein EV426DRAFT_645762 [Tirmania nivea]|nr:hypothetical protein EV426DRAFT_645762 [Tirmania nivea]
MPNLAPPLPSSCRWLHNNPKWNFGRFNTEVDLKIYPLFDLQFRVLEDCDSEAKIRIKNSLKEYKKDIWKDALTEMKKDPSQAGKAAKALSDFWLEKRSRSESPPAASTSKSSRRRGNNEAEHLPPSRESPVPPPAYRPSTPKPIGSNVPPSSPPHTSKSPFNSREILDNGWVLEACARYPTWGSRTESRVDLLPTPHGCFANSTPLHPAASAVPNTPSRNLSANECLLPLALKPHPYLKQLADVQEKSNTSKVK